MSLSIKPSASGFRLEATCHVPAPLDVVFPFFSDARNLEQLTPKRLRFRILTQTDLEMHEGLLIDYRIMLGVIPMRWQSEITVWEPPFRFVDAQRRGPYRRWVHEHRFEPDGDSTICTDVVDYIVPGGRLVHALFVRRDLKRIFAFRKSAMERIFAEVPRVVQTT